MTLRMAFADKTQGTPGVRLAVRAEREDRAERERLGIHREFPQPEFSRDERRDARAPLPLRPR
jgi:hypothetical protein